MFTKIIFIALALFMVVEAGNLVTYRKYVGCYKDTDYRDVRYGAEIDDVGMNVGKCIAVCRGKGYRLAGLQSRAFCFCDNRVGLFGPAPESECNLACTGDSREMCGGEWRNSVYAIIHSSSKDFKMS